MFVRSPDDSLNGIDHGIDALRTFDESGSQIESAGVEPAPSPEERSDFESLYRTTAQSVSRFVARRIRHDVSDLVSDVYVIAWTKRDRLPADDKARLLWLYSTARRLIANRLRMRSRLDQFNRATLSLRRSSHIQPTGSEYVLETLARLRKVDREALLLVFWDGLSVEEAAQVSGVSTPAMTKRLHTAREAFARIFVPSDSTSE